MLSSSVILHQNLAFLCLSLIRTGYIFLSLFLIFLFYGDSFAFGWDETWTSCRFKTFIYALLIDKRGIRLLLDQSFETFLLHACNARVTRELFLHLRDFFPAFAYFGQTLHFCLLFVKNGHKRGLNESATTAQARFEAFCLVVHLGQSSVAKDYTPIVLSRTIRSNALGGDRLVRLSLLCQMISSVPSHFSRFWFRVG